MKDLDTNKLEEGLVETAKVAGDEILADYNNPDIVIKIKKDNSPVTDTDPRVEKIIMGRLEDLTPSIKRIGEEDFSAGNAPELSSDDEYFWLIDALDGTKSFIRGRCGIEGEEKSPEFTVNIALMKKQQDGTWSPVLGVVYAPALDEPELFLGNVETKTAFVERNGKREYLEPQAIDTNNIRIIEGYKHKRVPEYPDNKVAEVKEIASSLKFMRIAENKADASALPDQGMAEWDIAASHAIIKALGGNLINADGSEVTYGHEPYGIASGINAYRNPEFIPEQIKAKEMLAEFKQKYEGKLSDDILNAAEFAMLAHMGQKRKGSGELYIGHSLGVAGILIENNASEEVIIAGLLHDVVEDTPRTLKDIEDNFGSRVAELVEGASEPDKSLSWEERKEHTIHTLGQTKDKELKELVCADKLFNIREMAKDYSDKGEEAWSVFKRGEISQAWYFTSIAETMNDIDKPMARELKAEVRQLFPSQVSLAQESAITKVLGNQQKIKE